MVLWAAALGLFGLAVGLVLGSGKRARVPMLTRRCDGALPTARYDGLDVISPPYARVGSARLALELLLLLPDAKAGEKPAKTLERLRRRVDALALRRWGALVRSRTLEKKRLAKKPRRVDARLGRPAPALVHRRLPDR